MTQYTVMVELTVESDTEQDAYYACQGAVENLMGGAITEATVDSVDSVDEAIDAIKEALAEPEQEQK